MGAVTSHDKNSQPEVEYNVHGLYYWPGKCIPYKKWPAAILNQGTGGTYDELTIIKGGAKSKRAKVMARFQKLIDSYSDSDLHDVRIEKMLRRLKQRTEGFINTGIEDSVPDHCTCNATDTVDSTETSIGTNANQANINRISIIEEKCEYCDKKAEEEHKQKVLKDMNIRNKIENDFGTEELWRNPDMVYPFENIVFSGGGIRGYSYIGAIKALEDAGIMPHIKRFAGSSAGAMCMAAVAVGYTAQDIVRFFYVDLKQTFQDQQCACICCVPRLYTRYGIHPAKRYYTGLGHILANKSGNPDLTFKQYNEMFGKELCIVVCNITKMTAEYCHHLTTPDLPIRKAVRMSMAVPCIYEPPVMEIDGQVNYYVDGGAADHFPLHCFDGEEVGMNLNSPPNWKTIGFYCVGEKDVNHILWKNAFGKTIPTPYKPSYLPDSKLASRQLKEQIKKRKKTERNFNEKAFMHQLEKFSHASLEHLGLRMKHYDAPNKTHFETNNILDYIVANLESLLISQVISNLKPKDENRIIPINCGYVESHNYELEPADREFMIKQGYQSTRHFLQTYATKKITERRESSV